MYFLSCCTEFSISWMHNLYISGICGIFWKVFCFLNVLYFLSCCTEFSISWRHNLYISGICGIFWNVFCFFNVLYFCHVVQNFPFHGGITCIYLEFAEYSGMFFVF